MGKVKYGVCIWSMFPGTPKEKCVQAHELGLDGIELVIGNDYKERLLLSKENCDELMEVGKKYSLTFTSIGINAICNCAPFDPDNKADIEKIMDISIKTANNMGIKLLQVPAFGKAIINNDEELDGTIAFLKRYCEKASEYGITVASENALSSEQNKRMIDNIGMDNFKIYFDTQNPYVVNGYSSAEIFEELKDSICEVHAKDGYKEMSNRLLGEGDSDFARTCDVMKRCGYEGWIHLENNYMRIARNDVEKAKESIKKDILTLKKIFG